MSEASDHVIWWHVYPLGFAGGRGLDHVTAWLDHVVELGANGIALGPIFASATHGYDTIDHFRIDPRLGDEADLDRLIAACRERGIRVLLDGVFNHVGRAHPAFQDALANGPGSAGAALFDIAWPDGWSPGDPVEVGDFEGHSAMVKLDHSSPAVEELVVDAMMHWLDRGIDGWRLDVAYAVPPEFWRRVTARVRERHPDAWFLGEVIHGDYAEFVRESGVDTVTQYELWQGIWHGIADGNLFELKHAIERHDALLATFVPQTFVGNHDVTRIASAVGEDRVPHALAVLFGVAGTPSVWAGDEYGWTGVKEERLGGDDAVRPEFPPMPPAGTPLTAIMRELIALRRQRPWLTRANTDVVAVTNEAMVLRTATDEGALVVAINIGDSAVELPSGGLADVVAGSARVDDGMLELDPLGWAVLAG